MSVLTDRTKRFSTPKDPRNSLGQTISWKQLSSLDGETTIVSDERTIEQPSNYPVPQFTGITREERDRNVETSVLAGIEGATDFGRGAQQWYKSGVGSNLTDGRYFSTLNRSLVPSNWYTVKFAKDIVAMGKSMAAQNKSTSYRIGVTTAAITEALITLVIAKPFLTLTESLGRLSWPIVKNIGTKFVKTFIKKVI